MKRVHILLAGLLAASFSHAANWSNWRGPEYNGSSPETGLPDKFSKTENVLWTADMPGSSGATPVIHGDDVFVNSVDVANKTRVAICLDRKTGKVRWQKEVGPGISRDHQSDFASPSALTDGKLVYFFYGNGDLVCYDIDGKQVWSRNIQKDYGDFAFLWTFSSSPVLYDGKLFLQVLQRDTPVNRADPLASTPTDKPIESFLLAFDPATGKELWKAPRPSEARSESREAFSTPLPYVHNGQKQLILTGGDAITGHDVSNGKELWRWGSWNPQRVTHWRLVPSPVAAEGVALACAPKGGAIYAVKLGLSGNLDDSAIAWKSAERDISSDVPTPAYYKGHFYILNGDKRKLLCVEAKTGKLAWSGDLDTRAVFQSSPTVADGKVYMMDFKGNVFVVSAAPGEFKLISSAAMGDESDNKLRPSIPISQGQLFVRTGKKLYCIGRK